MSVWVWVALTAVLLMAASTAFTVGCLRFAGHVKQKKYFLELDRQLDA